MEVALIGIGVGLLINILIGAFTYGKLTQKVDSLHKQINNGFICKFHSTITERLGRIEGSVWDGTERRKPWNGKERRKPLMEKEDD